MSEPPTIDTPFSAENNYSSYNIAPRTDLQGHTCIHKAVGLERASVS